MVAWWLVPWSHDPRAAGSSPGSVSSVKENLNVFAHFGKEQPSEATVKLILASVLLL